MLTLTLPKTFSISAFLLETFKGWTYCLGRTQEMAYLSSEATCWLTLRSTTRYLLWLILKKYWEILQGVARELCHRGTSAHARQVWMAAKRRWPGFQAPVIFLGQTNSILILNSRYFYTGENVLSKTVDSEMVSLMTDNMYQVGKHECFKQKSYFWHAQIRSF